MPKYQKAKSVLEAARQLRSEAAKRDLDARQRCEEAKSILEAAKQLRSEAAKRNILFSPLEGEKKFLSELCELRNFREGYKKYKNTDRATECAMTNVGKVNKNNLQQKQSSCLAPLSPAVSAVYISLLGKYAQPTFETNYSPLTILP